LTLVAARTLRDWELVLAQRLHKRAGHTIRDVADRMQAKLDDDLAELQSTMGECVRSRATVPEMREKAGRLCGGRELVSSVYLFMNPWGFLFPEQTPATSPGRAAPAGEAGDDTGGGKVPSGLGEVLLAKLRYEIARSQSLNVRVQLALDDRAYCFAPLPHRTELYVGFEVDVQAYAKRLAAVLDDYRGGEFALRVSGLGTGSGDAASRDAGSIVVTDSFSSSGGDDEGEGVQERDAVFPGASAAILEGKRPVAAGRLHPPFEHVRVIASLADPGEFKRAGAVQSRLYGWGILVLGAGVLIGVWLVVWEATSQVRRARSRSEFVIGASHDLRTPLASMKVLAESLYFDHVKSEAKKRKFLGVIVGECERLAQLTERVLYFVRFGQDALVYRPNPANVGNLVREIVDGFISRQTPLEGKGDSGPVACRVECDIAGELPQAAVDEGAVQQLVTNLLDNALRYGQPEGADAGGSRIGVRVSRTFRRPRWLGRAREWGCISVRDWGAGIGRRDRRRVFRRFYRARSAREVNLSGVGLGLALCRHVALAHGGWIEVVSKEGDGATFTVYLPALDGHGGRASSGARGSELHSDPGSTGDGGPNGGAERS